jgi:hypothetical protein
MAAPTASRPARVMIAIRPSEKENRKQPHAKQHGVAGMDALTDPAKAF